MSAERLRAASALMRARAEKASPSPWLTYDAKEWYGGGPAWEVDYVPTEGDFADEPVQVSGGSGQADAYHIASWHPSVALAVAHHLAVVADGIEGERRGDDPAYWRLHETAALAVADAYMADSSPP